MASCRVSSLLAAVPADLAPWGAAEEAELSRLVELAAGRCEGARKGAVSLQAKLRGEGDR